MRHCLMIARDERIVEQFSALRDPHKDQTSKAKPIPFRREHHFNVKLNVLPNWTSSAPLSLRDCGGVN